jgi:hypothetical protein
VALWSLQTSRTRWKFSNAESLFRCDVSCTRNSVGHTEFLPRRTSEIPMENFTCKRLLSALSKASVWLAGDLDVAGTLRASSVEKACTHLQHSNTPARQQHSSTLRALCGSSIRVLHKACTHLQRRNTTRRCGHSACEFSLTMCAPRDMSTLERDETCARDGERHDCESIFCSHSVLYF